MTWEIAGPLIFIYVMVTGGFGLIGGFNRIDDQNSTLAKLSVAEFAAVVVLWPVFFVMLVVWGLARIYSIGRKLIGD